MTNYFDEMRILGRRIDDGIAKLTDTWKSPQLFISTCGEINSNEAESSLGNLRQKIKSIKNDISEDLSQNGQAIFEFQQFFDESMTMYNELKQQCDDIETLFVENGYTAQPIDPVEFEQSTVEVSPDVIWHRKSKSPNHPDSHSVKDKNIERVMSSNTTPLKCIPQEPLYSPHYYNLINKKNNK